jgi:hypothetical protein
MRKYPKAARFKFSQSTQRDSRIHPCPSLACERWELIPEDKSAGSKTLFNLKIYQTRFHGSYIWQTFVTCRYLSRRVSVTIVQTLATYPSPHRLSADVTQIKRISQSSFHLSSPDLLLRSHHLFVFDRQTSDGRKQILTFSRLSWGIHESWEHNHYDKANILLFFSGFFILWFFTMKYWRRTKTQKRLDNIITPAEIFSHKANTS